MSNIYELANTMSQIWEMIEDETLEDDVLFEVFTNATDDLKDKMENCCKYLKNTKADIDGLDAEIKRLQEKKKSLENGSNRLKALMLRAQNACGEKKLECGTFTTTIQNNPPKCVIDAPLAGIPNKYLIAQEPKVDTAKLKEDLKNGVDGLIGVAHLEQSEGIRVR